ncbi:MAG: BTAD domain-containing putative transcriptional regulator [Anaerolineae bacterium]
MSRLEIRLLGGFEVWHGDQRVDDFESQKVRALLAYLVLHADSAHSRDRLAGLMWPEKDDDTARRNLRQAVYNLRTALPHADTPAPPILATRQSVQFNRETDYWVDVATLEESLRMGASGAGGIDPYHLAEASDLYRGDFLAGFFVADSPVFEHWLLYEQERLREMAIQALRRLVDYYLACGEYRRGIQYVRRLLGIDPLFEEAHRKLVRLYALSGRRNRALAQYEDCRQLLLDELGVEPLDETTALYRAVLAEDQLVEPAANAGDATGPAIPFVGRGAAHARLRRSWEAARQGMGRLTLVEGEAGIGKTCLIERFISDAAAGARVIVLSGRCHDFAPPVAYQPLAEALQRMITEQPHLAKRALAGMSPRSVADLVPIVGDLSSLRSDLTGLATPPPGEARDRLFDGIVCFLEALIQAGDSGNPVDSLILFWDDLHWADRPSLELLEYLVRRLDGKPIWIVAAYWPEHLGSTHPMLPLRRKLSRDQRVDRVALSRLSFADIQRIATAIMGDRQAGDLARFLDRESAGLPLTIAELINYLHDEGVLVNRAGQRWALAGPLPVLATPSGDNLDELILGRVSQLPTSARRLLTLAAVVGPQFDAELLQRADGEHIAVVDAGIDTWLQRQLVRPVAPVGTPDKPHPSTDSNGAASRGRLFEFAHDRIRVAVYHDVNWRRRKVMHQQVAVALEEQRATDTWDVCEALAHHYLAAGAWSKALVDLQQAADKARQALADEIALYYYDQMLEVLDRLENRAASDAERHAYLEQRLQVLTSRAEMYYAKGVQEMREVDLRSMRDIVRQLSESERLSSMIAQLGES